MDIYLGLGMVVVHDIPAKAEASHGQAGHYYENCCQTKIPAKYTICFGIIYVKKSKNNTYLSRYSKKEFVEKIAFDTCIGLIIYHALKYLRGIFLICFSENNF